MRITIVLDYPNVEKPSSDEAKAILVSVAGRVRDIAALAGADSADIQDVTQVFNMRSRASEHAAPPEAGSYSPQPGDAVHVSYDSDIHGRISSDGIVRRVSDNDEKEVLVELPRIGALLWIPNECCSLPQTRRRSGHSR